MNRRGFTLMEMLLAVSLSAMLVLMIVAMFGFIDRSEGAQVRRAEQIEALARIHKVMERVFSAVVVAEQTPAAALQSGLTEASADGKRRRQREPGRMLLTTDQSSSLNQAMKRAHTGSGSVQRLEVVLNRMPVPRNFARGLTGDVGTSMQANQTGEEAEITGPIRGVFELRPDAATIRVEGKQEPQRADGRTGWTLWWRALPFSEDGPDPALVDPTEDPAAVPIASGLASCNWKAFVNRERKDTLTVTTYLQIPAYMEMEVMTLGGFYASWMFEMQWTIAQDDGGDAERRIRELAAGRLQAGNTPVDARGNGRNVATPPKVPGILDVHR